MNFIYELFGKLLYGVYVVVKNYGLSIVLFTIIIKIILLPLTLKQTNSMKKMQEIQPKLEEHKKYKHNKEALNQKMMDLYREHNYNPAGDVSPYSFNFLF